MAEQTQIDNLVLEEAVVASEKPSSYREKSTHEESNLFSQVDYSQPLKDFYELLFTKPLVPYFRSVFKTNMNGFSSGATAVPGLWKAYVYETDKDAYRSAVPTQKVRKQFVDAILYLGRHLREMEKKDSSTNYVLKYIKDNELTPEQILHFDMFFNIMTLSEPLKSVSIQEFKRSGSVQTHRINVKKYVNMTVSGAYTQGYKNTQQGGAAPTKKLALITTFLPLLKSNDVLPEYLNDLVKGMSSLRSVSAIDMSNLLGQKSSIVQSNYNAGVSGTEVGGGRQVGGTNDDEIRSAVLRIECQYILENNSVNPDSVNIILSSEDAARYLACNPESTRVPSVLDNKLTLAALPTNSWRKLSDGSYEKLTPQGYQPLSKEECERVLQGTCAGSAITDNEVCQEFMEAINSQNETAILSLLSKNDVWESNTATDSLSKLHPETVLRILKALKFGTKNGPFGKRVCTVDEWLSECVKGTTYDSVSNSLSPSMRSYLEHLVNFVNSNPSLIDPSKRPFAGRTFQNVPNVFTERGLYYAGEDMHSTNNLLTFADVNRAIQQHQSGINLLNVVMKPAMAYGAVLPQRGGTPYIYTQPAQAQLSLGNGISQLLEQTLNGLKATSYGISQEDETKIREKVAKLTTLEQEIYQNIMVLNEQRLAVESGVNLHSQLASTQDRLMHLGSMYDRRVPCLQELCEQLRLLLAQQQNKNGCQQIE